MQEVKFKLNRLETDWTLRGKRINRSKSTFNLSINNQHFPGRYPTKSSN